MSFSGDLNGPFEINGKSKKSRIPCLLTMKEVHYLKCKVSRSLLLGVTTRDTQILKINAAETSNLAYIHQIITATK
jgi:hypothetical protein